jgi:thymidylate synthase (FAD)
MRAELLDVLGDDRMIVNAARVSYGKEVEEFSDRDRDLLNYLVEHGHTSPFRHPQLQFRISCPIFVERQLFKHQVGLTANSISGRYVDFSDRIEPMWALRKQSKSSKQGSEGYLPTNESDRLRDRAATLAEECQALYAEMCEAGVAKEQARAVLPLSLETTFIWTGSLAAFLHLFKLRLKPDAQMETQVIVSRMLSAVEQRQGNPFRHTLEIMGL